MVAVPEEELRQLRESAEKYRMMIDQASDAILAISPESGRILEANRRTEEMTGYALGELLGMKVWDLHPPEERDEAKRLFGKVTARGNGSFRDFHFRRKDGSLAVIDVSASMVTYGGRKVIQRLCRDVTERRQLEQENALLREYYERILDMMPVGLGVKRNVDSIPKVDFENQKLKEMFHGDEDDSVHAAWHGSRLEPGAEEKVFLTEGGAYAKERSLANGHTYQFTSSFFKSRDDIWCEAQVVEDITPRKEAEKLVQAHNRAIADLARFPSENPNPVIRVDGEDTILYANSSSQLRLKQWDLGVGKTVPQELAKTIAEARQAQEPKEIELKLIDRTFAFLCAPVEGADYVNLYGRDITHRKRAESELEHSLSLLRATLDSTTDGILVVDKEGKVVNCNRKFMKMWGVAKPIGELRCTREEMGFVLSQLRNPELFLSRVSELQANPEAESQDVLEFKDGRIYERYSQPQRLGNSTVGRVWSFRDVTEERRARTALRESHEELEEKVEARTLELRQKQSQLVQSEKMAALGQLVAGVAHEINTPLGALTSNIDIFARTLSRIETIVDEAESIGGTQNEKLKQLLSSAGDLTSVSQTAAERIVTIVGSLRRFARLDEAELDEVDLHEGIENTLTLVQHELKNRIQVEKDYGEIPRVKCYPNQLNQVFMNLLVNASHAIEGQGSIAIRTRQEGDQVLIEFRDSGRGIPQENLERIFDPGFTTKGSGVGTGLGLSIVYRIVQDHRGSIQAESEVGKGSTFKLLLPIRREEVERSENGVADPE